MLTDVMPAGEVHDNEPLILRIHIVAVEELTTSVVLERVAVHEVAWAEGSEKNVEKMLITIYAKEKLLYLNLVPMRMARAYEDQT
jgi:hypothetical protein